MITDYRWRNIDLKTVDKIKSYLLFNSAQEHDTKNDSEVWKLKYKDSFFTFYSTGTLYATSSRSDDPSVLKATAYIDSIFKSTYTVPSRKFVIGLSDTGRAELTGHIILAGVMIPENLFSELDLIINKSRNINEALEKIPIG